MLYIKDRGVLCVYVSFSKLSCCSIMSYERHIGFCLLYPCVSLDIRVVFWYNTVYMIGGELWRRLGDRRRKNRILIR